MSLSSQRVNYKKCLNTKKTIGNGMFVQTKTFARMESVWVLRIGLRSLMKKHHDVDKTIKFSLAHF